MEGGFERGSAATARGLPFVRKAPAKPVMRFEEADPTGWQQHQRRSPEAFSGQFLVVERLGEPRAQQRSEIIFDACSDCRVRASTLPASAQLRRACLQPSGDRKS